MKEINYKVEFHTYWHCGSGLAAGADVDALVVKNEDNLPYIPGKTMKGLVREAVEEILGFAESIQDKESVFIEAFGYFDDAQSKEKGCTYFTNAELNYDEAQTIVDKNLTKYLYHSLSSTAIGENGVAKPHSLRKIQVTVPCTVYGTIKDIPDGMFDTVANALLFIKRLGQNRNRGLGRCTISLINEGGEK